MRYKSENHSSDCRFAMREMIGAYACQVHGLDHPHTDYIILQQFLQETE